MTAFPAFLAGLATGVFVALGGGFLGLRYAQAWNRQDDDEPAAPAERKPRCGAMTPNPFKGEPPVGPCMLEHGHPGMHEESGRILPGYLAPVPGARWGQAVEEDADAR